MKIQDIKTKIENISQKYKDAYYNYRDGKWVGGEYSRHIYEHLKNLTATQLTKTNIDKIIGNTNWTKLICNHCNDSVDTIIIIDDEPYNDESPIISLCKYCILKAYNMIIIAEHKQK